MKKKTKKSGRFAVDAAPQPNGCVSRDTSILPRKNMLVTLAWTSVGLGILWLFVGAGTFDTELLSGVEGLSVSRHTLIVVSALTAIVTGLIALKLEGALDD